eukprot:4233257-Prymnesium_polylepis.1
MPTARRCADRRPPNAGSGTGGDSAETGEIRLPLPCSENRRARARYCVPRTDARALSASRRAARGGRGGGDVLHADKGPRRSIADK